MFECLTGTVPLMNFPLLLLVGGVEPARDCLGPPHRGSGEGPGGGSPPYLKSFSSLKVPVCRMHTSGNLGRDLLPGIR